MDGILLGTDHGPKGGDEINIIEHMGNYGWPCKSYGILYSKFSTIKISTLTVQKLMVVILN